MYYRSAYASLPKTEIVEDFDPTKSQPVQDPAAVLAKAIQLIGSPDEDWYVISTPCLNMAANFSVNVDKLPHSKTVREKFGEKALGSRGCVVGFVSLWKICTFPAVVCGSIFSFTETITVYKH